MSYSKFMRGSELLQSGDTTPGCHLTTEEKKVFNQTLDKCKEYGLVFYPTIIQKVRYDEMSEIAAYGGFPHRYPHWYWGMQYEELQRGYEYNQHRIYELVVNCCVPGIRVLTTEGTKLIENVEVGNTVISPNGLRVVIANKKQESSKIFNIYLTGMLTPVGCTSNHKWLILDGTKTKWVEASSLRVGDKIFAGAKFNNFLENPTTINWDSSKIWDTTLANVRNRLKPISPPKQMTLEPAELLGICGGDGSQGVPGAENAIAVAVDSKQQEYIEHITKLMKSVFKIDPAIYHSDKSCSSVQLNSKYAVDYFNFTGMKKGVTFESKTIPDSIWASSNEYRSAYLRGIFDTDGYVGKYLSMSSKSKALAEGVQGLLLEMGIRSEVSHVQNTHNDIYVLIIKNHWNRLLFFQYIGFSLKYKQERLKKLLSGFHGAGRGMIFPDIQMEIVNRIKSYKNYKKLPTWIKRVVRISKKGKNLHQNALYEFVNRLTLGNFGNFDDLQQMLSTPMYQVQSVEDAGESETYDIALDHDQHDFLANGLVTHNTNPCIIYILASNTMVDNVTVVAHATGHNDFFKNNIFFTPTDENMMNKLANHGTRIRKYMSRWGREKVTEFIDHVLRIQTLIDPAKAWTEREIRDPIIKDKRDYDFPRRLKVNSERLHMDPWINPKSFIQEEHDRIEKQDLAKEMELFQISEKDIFGFLKNYAHLKPWQQDIISMLYEESMYFSPQRATKTLNEGWACICRNSLVLTKLGFVKIQNLHKTSNEVHDGNKLRKIINHFELEEKECLKVVTKRGFTIEGSITHRLLDGNYNWKRLDELSVGDELVINKGTMQWAGQYQKVNFKIKQFSRSLSEIARLNYISRDKLYTILEKNDFSNTSEKLRRDLKGYLGEKKIGNFLRRKSITIPNIMDEEFATFLGYMIGDGHINKDGRTSGLTSGDVEQADNYIRLAKTLFGLDCSKQWDDSSKNGRWRVIIHSKHLGNLLVNLGLPTGVSARIKEIPEIILQSPKSVMSAFLRAYFDCDGGAYTKNGIILSTSSVKLSEQLQIVLLNYGILSSKYNKAKDNYHIYISNDSAKLFYYEIGFGLERKQDALNNYIKRKRLNIETPGVDEVVSIEKIGKQTVYDITVDESHRYSAQGLINHNSHVDYVLMMKQGLVSLGQKSHDMGAIEYALHKMGVLGGKYSTNPYKTGFYLLLDIEERWNKGQFGTQWEECKDMRQKEEWDLKLNLGKEKVFEVRKYYNDVTLINEYFTQEFCDKFEYFEYKHYPNGEWKIESRDAKRIKRKLLQNHINGGLPDIRIVDPNHRNKGYFLLQHYPSNFNDKTIYEPYARAVLTSIHYLWGREVMLATQNKNNEECVYVCVGSDPEKDVAILPREDYEKTWT